MRLLFGLLALAALIVACQSASPAAGSKPPAASVAAPAPPPAAVQPSAPTAAPTVALREETVKTAIPKTLSDAGVSIGLARGYFQEQAIVLDDIYIPTGGEMVSSLATGQVEAALRCAERGAVQRHRTRGADQDRRRQGERTAGLWLYGVRGAQGPLG